MKKKVIKRKNYNTNNKRVKKKIKFNKNNLKILALAGAIILLLLSYLMLGKAFTILTAIGLGIIYGIWFLVIREKNGKKRKKITNIIIIVLLLIGISGLVAFSAFILYVKSIADPKFKVSKLNTLQVSRIYDSAGTEIAKLGSENREKVTYEQLPEVLVDAIVATEDSRFFQHNGFDAPRFLKAIIGQVTRGSEAGGASTISMQVTKNSFTDPLGKYTSGKKGIIRKFEDIYLTVFKLEKKYSKEQIIEYYVNNHFLGGNIYGVQEASKAYFGKDVTDLNLSEAAIIAGMFKSPNFYRPTVNPKNAEARRETVLYYMKKAGYITQEEQDAANNIPVETLTLAAGASNDNPYQGYIDAVVDEVQEKYNVNPYDTPVLVYTNLDISRQNGVNQVLNGETYDWINDKVQTGVAVIDTPTGKVLAIGNGRNINSRNNSTADQFNYATHLKRQPGSTAKPLFDYGPGIEYNNWSTYEQFVDGPWSYSNGRSIKNWDGGYFGQITLRRALAASRNIPALKAFQSVENEKIKEFVTNLGLTPEICKSGYVYDKVNKNCYNKTDKTDVTETIALHEAHSIGAFTGVSPLEMAAAYAAFSNGGVYNEPYTVSKIVFRQSGETVEHNEEKYVVGRRVMSDATAFMISSVLQDVSLTGGTPRNVACKTGTTNYDEQTMINNHMPGDAIRDSWVIGYSTRTVIGMWYGYDYIDKNGEYVLRNVPATIQKDRLFNALVASGAMEADRSEFVMPESVSKVAVAAGSNPAKKAVPGGGVVYEYFKKGFEPTEYDISNYKLPAPANLSASVSGNRVMLSWSPVSPGEIGDASHGAFGYNVYKDGVLLTWTDKTTYSCTPDNVYGTYKVIATYKSYNDIQSAEATYILQKPEEKPTPKPEEPETPEEPTTPEEPQNPSDQQENKTNP